jgi:hypothetical protein
MGKSKKKEDRLLMRHVTEIAPNARKPERLFPSISLIWMYSLNLEILEIQADMIEKEEKVS